MSDRSPDPSPTAKRRRRARASNGERPSLSKTPLLALSWSGGKDSALALWALRHELGREPSALITTVTEGYERVSMHGVRRELVRRQAEALGLRLVEVSAGMRQRRLRGAHAPGIRRG